MRVELVVVAEFVAAADAGRWPAEQHVVNVRVEQLHEYSGFPEPQRTELGSSASLRD